MNFNSPTFLFFFLPVSLLLYFTVDWRYKNWIALAASLVFYAWGQWFYLPLLLALIGVNFFLAGWIAAARARPAAARRWLALGVALDLALLLFFKVVAAYGSAWLSFLPSQTVAQLAQNPLPLGLSYITFQVVAYLIDVYNEVHEREPSLLNFALYVLLFPKLILGPITRYRDLAGQLGQRTLSAAGAAAGARRFITGLAKKALIADVLARAINPALALPAPDFAPGVAWLLLVGFALQLYFDFSGYSDMAIGLGQMLGFRFMENFNYPYIARSVGEFWRRWHISLSGWFRDYVFLPLEFARRGTPRLRQQTNILIVFLLTGLWHGVTLNFVLWGLIHGLALALEMTGFGRWLKKAWPPLQHAYTLLVVLLAWVFFRAPNPGFAAAWLARLAGSSQGLAPLPYALTRPLPIVDPSVWLALLLGLLFSLPLLPAWRQAWRRWCGRHASLAFPGQVGADLFLLFLLLSSVAATAGSTLVASIYGGF